MQHHSLFDIQVNGFAGVDFQRRDLQQADLRRAIDALRRHETHRILLTLITDEIDALCAKIARVEQFRRDDAVLAETICGYHLEGPFLSRAPGYCGAHRADLQRAPDIAAFDQLDAAAHGSVRLVTIAPEWPGSAGFISNIVARGIVVSLGHTNATDTQIDDAISAGARLCTHLGNAVPQQLPRHDNIIQRLLARDELIACFIPDGIHLPPAVLRNFFRAKPPGKVILTTDAMAAAAAPPGRYTLGDAEVEAHPDGVVRRPGSENFAGSSLTPDRGVANAAAWLDLSREQARALLSTRVAEIFAIDLPMVDTATSEDDGQLL
jgi:N-acetylglucosamine-6-phosphate deacetylase